MQPAEGVNFIVLQMIPCIMHMDTRVGLKILTVILQDGLSNRQGRMLERVNDINSEYQRKEVCCEGMNNVINTKVLGNNDNKW